MLFLPSFLWFPPAHYSCFIRASLTWEMISLGSPKKSAVKAKINCLCTEILCFFELVFSFTTFVGDRGEILVLRFIGWIINRSVQFVSCWAAPFPTSRSISVSYSVSPSSFIWREFFSSLICENQRQSSVIHVLTDWIEEEEGTLKGRRQKEWRRTIRLIAAANEEKGKTFWIFSSTTRESEKSERTEEDWGNW